MVINHLCNEACKIHYAKACIAQMQLFYSGFIRAGLLYPAIKIQITHKVVCMLLAIYR